MYLLARKGGERVLRKMVSAERMARGRATFQKWGLLAVLVPSILPPPAPFKVFVLLAGVVQIPLWQFIDGDRRSAAASATRRRPCWRAGTGSRR